jgi:hypothetical protein
MKSLMAIIDDLSIVESDLAGYLGLQPIDNIYDCILNHFNEKNINDAERLSDWFKEYFGRHDVIKILTKLNIQYDAWTSFDICISKWFEYRMLIISRPAIRPIELSENIHELALQAKSTPENFTPVNIFIPFLECLLRYIAYYYSEDLITQTNYESLCKKYFPKIDDIARSDIFRNFNIQDLCCLLSYDSPCNYNPYNSNCKQKVKLANTEIKNTLQILGNIENQNQSNNDYPGSLISLLDFWHFNENQKLIPKGAIIKRSERTFFRSDLICYDEFNSTITLEGVSSELSSGDHLLLSFQIGGKCWASNIKSIPTDDLWKTPCIDISKIDVAHSDDILINYRRRNYKIFISYSRKDIDIVTKIKERIKKEGFTIFIDSETFQPGTDLRRSIADGIGMSNVILSFISENSLKSDWVAIETTDVFSNEAQSMAKKFIGCCIDKTIFQKDITTLVQNEIGLKVKEIQKEINKRNEEGILSVDLDEKKNMLLYLSHNIPGIVSNLRKSLCLDFSSEEFENNMQKLIDNLDNFYK